MSTFLTGKELESKLTDIIWNAKKHIILISPFIKLDDHVKEVLEKIKSRHDISLYILFGKNEEYKHKSFNENDFNFIKEFKNVTILYNKDLHAKHYCNEHEGLITSLNLYGYSMVNNIEYGIYFSKAILNPLDKLYEETSEFTYDLLYNQSEVVYLKKPQYSNKLFGLKKVYQQSHVIFDISKEFFSGQSYESKELDNFDLDTETIIEKKFESKPLRNKKEEHKVVKKNRWENSSENIKTDWNNDEYGFCIRTREQIPFDPSKPYSYSAYQTWSQFENYDYGEKYCHKTGEKSYGKTSMNHPILNT